MPLMKQILLILTMAASIIASQPKKADIKEGFERAQERYERDACERARTQAKRNYEIVKIDVGCRCERTDDRLWQCDIGFTYRPKKSVEEDEE